MTLTFGQGHCSTCLVKRHITRYLLWPSTLTLLTLTDLTLTFGQGHSAICAVKRIATKHPRAKFCDWRLDSLQEIWQSHFFYLDLLTLTFWPWLSVKVIVLYMMGSVPSQSTPVPKLATAAPTASEKHGKVTFCDPWSWPSWPWPWVKVTTTNIIRSTPWQSTMMPNLATAAPQNPNSRREKFNV